MLRTARIEGIEAIEAVVAGTELEPTQLEPGTLTGSMVQILTEDRCFSTAEIFGSFRAFGPLSNSEYTVGAVIESLGQNNQWGVEASSGDLAVVPPGIEHDARYCQHSHWLTLGLPLSSLLEQAEAYELPLEKAFWEQPGIYRPSPRTRQSISASLKRVGQVIGCSLNNFKGEQTTRSLLDDVLETLFLGYREIGNLRPDSHGKFLSSTRLARNVDDYLRSHPGHAVRLTELCRHLGISARTLHRVFIDRYGIPPKRYLIYRRLCQARQMLTNEIPSTVTDVARGCGFWDLGRFAFNYRALFGETPSMTLRRSRLS